MAEATTTGGQAQRLREAIEPVLVLAPEFLAGRREADEMAHTMVRAVEEHLRREQERQRPGTPPELARSGPEPEVGQLEAVLVELHTCGSGYLADRCGADCVARTLTQVVGQLGG